MDRKEAFKVIQDAIAADADPKAKALAVAACVILEEVVKDFSAMAQAIKEMSTSPRITYAGPLPFKIVGNIAKTFDPSKEGS